jgi:aurora kinase
MLHHLNIAKFYASFKENSDVIIAMEYIKGFTLREYLNMNGGTLSESEAVNMVMRPIVRVLTYLHDLGIVHRDLKPENIMITTDGHLKLIDFGLAINVNEEHPMTRAGTLAYMAPEILMPPEDDHPHINTHNTHNTHTTPPENAVRVATKYDKSVDVWALGVIAYELIVGSTPFSSTTMNGYLLNLSKRKVYIPLNISKLACDFILKTLVWDKHERPIVNNLAHHPWLTKFDSKVRRHSIS